MDKIITISNSFFSLGLCAEFGSSITHFTAQKNGKTVHLMRPYDEKLPLDPLNFASFPLTPFSNRIGFGKLAFDGKEYAVGPTFGGEAHPNHGSGWQSSWIVKEVTADKIVTTIQVEADDQSPYSYVAEQTCQLTETGLDVTITLQNTGKETLPFGTGHHAYFIRTPKTIIHAQLPQVWLSEQMLPVELVDVPENWNFRDGRELDVSKLEAKHGGDGSAYIDHCFVGWDQVADITWPEFGNTTLRISADKTFPHFVIFVPSKGEFFCAEPVTNATNGFNLMSRGVQNTGTIVLAPEQSFTGRMSFDLLK